MIFQTVSFLFSFFLAITELYCRYSSLLCKALGRSCFHRHFTQLYCYKRSNAVFLNQHHNFMAALDMNSAAPATSLSHAHLDVITMVLHTMCLQDRFTCALVCKTWAEAATAATRSIVLERRLQDFSCLQQWLDKHGRQLKVLQLHECDEEAALTALPCPQLHNLLFGNLSINNKVWGDIASATKLTSVSLKSVQTACQQADVVSALAALPDLKQLTWHGIRDPTAGEQQLSDSVLLEHLTKLTALDLDNVSANALQHLGLLTKLQHLSIDRAVEWAAAGCPGLQELKALTRFQLYGKTNAPPSIYQLTALQQLELGAATPAELNLLQVLTGLTRLCVKVGTHLSLESAPLQLPDLQYLELYGSSSAMPKSYFAGCTQLRVLTARGVDLSAPGSLVVSTTLEHLTLEFCLLLLPQAAGSLTWRQVLPGPGQLPHLTSLQLFNLFPVLQLADVERLAESYSSLQRLKLDNQGDTSATFASALARLPALTSLRLRAVDNQQCRSLARLTGLRELTVRSSDVSDDGLRPLTALKCLTSLIFSWQPHPEIEKVSISIRQQLSDISHHALSIINKAPEGGPSDVSF